MVILLARARMERLSGSIMLLWGWRRALVAFLAGAFLVLSAAPFDFFAAGFVSFPVLVWLLDGAVPDRPGGRLRHLVPAFFVGWWFGFGYFVVGLWWVGMAMLVDAGNYAWAIPIAVVLLPAILALFYGFAASLARVAWSDGMGRVLALAAAFAIAEWLRTFVFTGFPWNPVGYAAMPIPLLMQSVGAVGTVGMNTLVVVVFAMPALLAGRRHRRSGLVVATALIAAHAGYGYFALSRPRGEPVSTLPVRIVQPAIDQARKIDRQARDEIFSTLLALSGQPAETGAPPPALIVWPETSVPFIFAERPESLTAIAELLADGQTLMAGAVRAEEGSGGDRTRYYNSIVEIDAVGEITGAVDKVHLVPGGEYLPLEGLFGQFGIDRIVAIPVSFAPGAGRRTLAAPGGLTAAAFVCYEMIFPDLVAEGVGAADLIVTVTNDGWFGDTPGPYQHLRQAQIRAVETGKPVVRAANTGISAVIDERGRILDALAIDARGTLDFAVAIHEPAKHAVPPRIAGFFLLLLAATMALAMRSRPRHRVG